MVFRDGKWVDEESQNTGQSVANVVKLANNPQPTGGINYNTGTGYNSVTQPPVYNYMNDVSQSLSQNNLSGTNPTNGTKRFLGDFSKAKDTFESETERLKAEKAQKDRVKGQLQPTALNGDGSGSFADGVVFDSSYQDEYGNIVYVYNGQVVKTIGANSLLTGDQSSLMTPNQDRYTNQLIAQLDNIMPGLLSSYQGMIQNKIDNSDQWGKTFDPTVDAQAAVDPTRYSTGSLADYLGEWSGNNQNSYDMLGDQANFDAVDAADRRQYERDIANSRAMGGNELHSRGRIADERDISNAFADRSAYKNEARANAERALRSSALESMLNRSQQYYNDQGARQSDYFDKDARADALYQAQKAANVNSYNDMALNSYIANQNNLMAGQQTDMGMMQGLANILGMPTNMTPFENIIMPETQGLIDSITGGGGIPGMISSLFG